MTCGVVTYNGMKYDVTTHRHLRFQFRNYNISNIDNIDGTFDCFKFTLFKRLCTRRQLVLLFNYHITHAVNLNEKKTPEKSKF